MYKVSEKKVKQLFKPKNKNPHRLCVIYEGTCAWNRTCISDTKRHARIKWDEHEDPRKESEPAKHLRSHPGHSFSWKVLLSAPANNHVRKIMKASIIALSRPTLNELVSGRVA